MKRLDQMLTMFVIFGGAIVPVFGVVEPIAIFQPGTRVLSKATRSRTAIEAGTRIRIPSWVTATSSSSPPNTAPPSRNLNLTFINRGISGNKVTDLEKRWQQDT